MLDLSWTEILLIAVIAVVILGPKELPVAMRTLARFVRKARNLTGEFQRHIDDMVREADLEDVRDTARSLKNRDLGREIDKTIDPDGEVRRSLEFDDTVDPTSGTKTSAPTTSAPTSAPTSAQVKKDARAETAVAGSAKGDEDTTTGDRTSGSGGI